jgi:hypothetical protein
MDCLVDYVSSRMEKDNVVMNEFFQLSKKLGPTYNSQTYRVGGLVTALASYGNKRLFTYQQQDAQEFFQQLSSMLTKEGVGRRRLGLLFPEPTNTISVLFNGRRVEMERIKVKMSPLTGLLASKISCLQCRHQVCF